jgi:hypothetical protein
MAVSLTPQQETFARAIALGKTQADAYREAYPKSINWKETTLHPHASTLAASDKVRARVA